MRHYETNSRPAATRLLALTVLADGGFDRNEVDALMEADLARRLGGVAAGPRLSAAMEPLGRSRLPLSADLLGLRA